MIPSSSVNNASPATQEIYVTSFAQKVAGFLSFFLSLTAVLMTVIWSYTSDDDELYLGGLNFQKKIFNWHPVLMVTGMVFMLISSLLAFRLLPYRKKITKALHAGLHSIGMVCVAFGLASVVISHNFTDHNDEGEHKPSIYSIHSIIGIITIAGYSFNFIAGSSAFLLKKVPMKIKVWFRPYHMFLGTIVLFEAVAAVATGITEVTRAQGCKNIVSSPDWNPADQYHRLEQGCKLANGIGIVVLGALFFCAYAMFGPKSSKLVNLDEGEHAEYL